MSETNVVEAPATRGRPHLRALVGGILVCLSALVLTLAVLLPDPDRGSLLSSLTDRPAHLVPWIFLVVVLLAMGTTQALLARKGLATRGRTACAYGSLAIGGVLAGSYLLAVIQPDIYGTRDGFSGVRSGLWIILAGVAGTIAIAGAVVELTRLPARQHSTNWRGRDLLVASVLFLGSALSAGGAFLAPVLVHSAWFALAGTLVAGAAAVLAWKRNTVWSGWLLVAAEVLGALSAVPILTDILLKPFGPVLIRFSVVLGSISAMAVGAFVVLIGVAVNIALHAVGPVPDITGGSSDHPGNS